MESLEALWSVLVPPPRACGLEVGERVIVEGLQKVRSGITVTPVDKRIDPKAVVLKGEGEDAQ